VTEPAQASETEHDASAVAVRLKALAAVSAEAGADRIAREAFDLDERLAQGRFFVACVGQFKRGKSTLLNALLGRSILSTGVVPVTAAVTVLRYGAALAAHVRFADGRRLQVDPSRLGEFVSEAENPENHKGVAAVEMTVPSPLLRSGMCLVDTPGLGSVFVANSATTRAFVPQIDAALVVVGTDPPISGEELELVEQVAAQVDSLVVVLNKCDRVADGESLEAAAFASRVIQRRLGIGAGDIYRVSASERLAGQLTRDWPRLEETLRALAGRSTAVVEAAAARGVSRIAHALLRELDEQRDALTRPIEESERRLATLRRAITDAEYARRDLSARMQVEQVALSTRFMTLRDRFLATEGPLARRELDGAVRSAPFLRGPACRAMAIDLAHDVARRRVMGWARDIEPRAEALYTDTIGRFITLANDFVGRLACEPSGDTLTPQEFVVERGFRHDAHFFFTSLLTLSAPGFWAWVLDWVRPRPWLLRSAVRQASEYLNRLMTTNSARMANDLTDRGAESQRRLEAEIRGRLSRLVDSAERALERARVQHASGTEAVRAQLARVHGLREQVEVYLLNTTGRRPGESSS
jgi:GTP-binding protein EngB required for normal cell division